jgi:hypothetical protein
MQAELITAKRIFINIINGSLRWKNASVNQSDEQSNFLYGGAIWQRIFYQAPLPYCEATYQDLRDPKLEYP